MEKPLQFNEEQTTEFARIGGLEKMKSRRGLLESEGSKTKLKPLERIQHFATNTPILSKGKHKIFK